MPLPVPLGGAMKRGKLTLLSVLVLLAAGLAVAAEQSLGDMARQIRQGRSKETRKAVKSYTNDNMPPPAPWEEVSPSQEGAKATPKADAEPKEAAPASTPAGPTAETPESQRTKEYWQDKFSTTRRELADEESAQRLAQDELSLLQIQQARELDPEIQGQVAVKIQAKQADLTAIQARVDVAQKALDDLQREFDASGAPAEWGQAEKPSPENQPPSP
jgi:hypothetical protein